MKLPTKSILIFISNSATPIFGYSSDELTAHSITDIVHQDDQENTISVFLTIPAQQKLSNFENRIVRKDGTVINMLRNFRWDEQTEEIFIVGKDITESKALEKERHLKVILN